MPQPTKHNRLSLYYYHKVCQPVIPKESSHISYLSDLVILAAEQDGAIHRAIEKLLYRWQKFLEVRASRRL
jgi:hypothetical protein